MSRQIDINQVRNLPEKIEELESGAGIDIKPIPTADIDSLFADGKEENG